ncbi:MAG TPA: hypothetical protein QGF70_02960 [Candidatus Thalassarchaeaceae archaeon]|jgi:hypothetical protein|nr:hypothetical protein [Candidatus Thalassarchaeaceae archaeon]|tara:strand:+ start:176 stop:919 length:744 start_codon:yes stop_codon:yes gene_type:complete
MYRLIWFQHIHKSAGTLVVNLAKENGEVLFKNNANGNPLDENGNRLELWDYNTKKLTEFIDQCEREGVTFVTTEHGSPDFRFLSEDDRVFLMTSLREPISRAVSNYNHAYFAGYTESSSLDGFLSENTFFMSDNFYTRTFAGKERFPLVRLNSSDVDDAISVIGLFDLVLKIEQVDLVKELSKEFDWENTKVDSHPTFGDPWKFWNLLKKRRFNRLLRYFLRLNAPGDFSVLENRYNLDIELLKQID